MKPLYFVLISFLMTSTAQANLTYDSCRNGDMNQVGDSYMQVDIYSDTVEFYPYEAGFQLNMSDFNISQRADNTTYAVSNKIVPYSVEGFEETLVLNLMMTWSADKQSLQLAYSRDYGPYRSVELACTKAVLPLQ